MTQLKGETIFNIDNFIQCVHTNSQNASTTRKCLHNNKKMPPQQEAFHV